MYTHVSLCISLSLYLPIYIYICVCAHAHVLLLPNRGCGPDRRDGAATPRKEQDALPKYSRYSNSNSYNSNKNDTNNYCNTSSYDILVYNDYSYNPTEGAGRARGREYIIISTANVYTYTPII